MCAKKRDRNSSDFLRYLKDDLSNQERHAFERELEADPFEKEAMEGLEGIPPEKAEEDILTLHSSLSNRMGRRRRRAWYSIAATAASILLVGTIFLNIYDLNPDNAENEPLTEESFRKLDSGKEAEKSKAVKSEKAADENAADENAVVEKPSGELAAPKNTPQKAPFIEASEELAPAEVAPEEVAPEEVAQEAISQEMLMEDDAEIVAVEAEPRRRKKSAVSAEAEAAEAAAPKARTAPSESVVSGQTIGQVSGQAIGQVSGIVVSSEDMDPLPGASIVIRGANSGTVSDMNGRFSLPSDDSQATVVASFIGMETEEYQLSSDSDNRLVMQPDPITLDEVVVVDHGSGSVKRELASSSTVVKTTDASPSYTAAEPADGFKAFQDFIEENMVLPGEYSPGDRMVVILRFTITSSGSLTGIETLRSPGEAYTFEAIRLLQEGPRWIPAGTENGPIDEQVRIRIVFKKDLE